MSIAIFPGTGMPDSGWWRILFPDPDAIIAAAGATAGMHAVDLCCGDGHFTPALVERTARVTAIDLDPALVAAARALAPSTASVRFVVGDAYDVAELITEPADLVFLANAFHGVPDKPRLARAVHAALNPGGLFVILNWHARPREETLVLGEPRGPATTMRMAPSEVADIVRSCGFEEDGVIDVPPYHYLSRFRVSDGAS
jgi:SAM-dependent methyltransferase